jgi:hypothetical protein
MRFRLQPCQAGRTNDLAHDRFSEVVFPMKSGNCSAELQRWEKGKGCDIGYALAINSCEEANSVDACTVTALDAITAFAVPDPNCPSQSRRFFQVWLLFRLPCPADHSAYFGSAKI